MFLFINFKTYYTICINVLPRLAGGLVLNNNLNLGKLIIIIQVKRCCAPPLIFVWLLYFVVERRIVTINYKTIYMYTDTITIYKYVYTTYCMDYVCLASAAGQGRTLCVWICVNCPYGICVKSLSLSIQITFFPYSLSVCLIPISFNLHIVNLSLRYTRSRKGDLQLFNK